MRWAAAVGTSAEPALDEVSAGGGGCWRAEAGRRMALVRDGRRRTTRCWMLDAGCWRGQAHVRLRHGRPGCIERMFHVKHSGSSDGAEPQPTSSFQRPDEVSAAHGKDGVRRSSFQREPPASSVELPVRGEASPEPQGHTAPTSDLRPPASDTSPEGHTERAFCRPMAASRHFAASQDVNPRVIPNEKPPDRRLTFAPRRALYVRAR